MTDLVCNFFEVVIYTRPGCNGYSHVINPNSKYETPKFEEDFKLSC